MYCLPSLFKMNVQSKIQFKNRKNIHRITRVLKIDLIYGLMLKLLQLRCNLRRKPSVPVLCFVFFLVGVLDVFLKATDLNISIRIA